MSEWTDDIAAFMDAECNAVFGPAGSDYTQEPVTVYIVASAHIRDLEAQLAQRDAALKAADDLAHETDRRINDLGGYDGRFPVRQALTAYRKARGQDETAKG